MAKVNKILIVEDQSIISTNIKLLLRKSKYEVSDVVATGEDALRSIEKNTPDLVLMDISLPGDLDGIETTEKINQKYDIPVIFLTAHSDDNTLDRAKKTSAFSYLTKDANLNNNLLLTLEFVFYRSKMDKEYKLTTDKLRDSEELFRSIADTAFDSIIVLDESGKITFWNKGAVEMFGYKISEAHAKSFVDLIVQDLEKNEFHSAISKISSENSELFGRKTEFNAVKSNGETLPVELMMSKITLKNQVHAVGIIRDISERKKFEEESKKLIEEISISRQEIENNAHQVLKVNDKLTKSESVLKELNQQKDKFISMIAHDLKNPFHGLMGYSEILTNNIDDLNRDDIVELAHDMNKTSHELFKLLENLLEWSRIQRGIFSNNPQQTNLHELVRLCMDLLSANAKQKNIDLQNLVDDDLGGNFDPNIINTVIRNILSNAIKFTNDNGLIKVSGEKNNGLLQIKVEDNGVGMDSDALKKIFDIEHHYSTRGTRSEMGSGLGLILCSELIKKIGGNIKAESEENKGSTFLISFPDSIEN